MSRIFRKITEHQVDPVNDQIRIQAVVASEDQEIPNSYWLSYDGSSVCLSFHHDESQLKDTNGITEQALLVVLADRLRCRQESKHTCEADAIALLCVERALKALST